MDNNIEMALTGNTSKISFKGKTHTIKPGDSMTFRIINGSKFVILWHSKKIQIQCIDVVGTVCESWYVYEGLKFVIATNMRPPIEDGMATACSKDAVIVLSHPVMDASITKKGKKEKTFYDNTA